MSASTIRPTGGQWIAVHWATPPPTFEISSRWMTTAFLNRHPAVRVLMAFTISTATEAQVHVPFPRQVNISRTTISPTRHRLVRVPCHQARTGAVQAQAGAISLLLLAVDRQVSDTGFRIRVQAVQDRCRPYRIRPVLVLVQAGAGMGLK